MFDFHGCFCINRMVVFKHEYTHSHTKRVYVYLRAGPLLAIDRSTHNTNTPRLSSKTQVKSDPRSKRDFNLRPRTPHQISYPCP